MSKTEVMGWVLLLGALAGCVAVLLSLLWHWLDKSLGEIEPGSGESFDKADARWNARRKLRDAVRVIGLICLYASLLAMGFGAAGVGIALIEGK